MSSGIEKLRQDLITLEAFAEEMDAYLRADVLFRPMGPSLPQLTLGGYLMRQYRLLHLRTELDAAENLRLDHALTRYQQALVEKIVRYEQHAHQELQARLRQWQEYLRDLQAEPRSAAAYYATAIEPRVMLDALLDSLRLPPYRLNSDAPQRLMPLDRNLRTRLVGDDFIWPAEWQPAYPRQRFWYLYGQLLS